MNICDWLSSAFMLIATLLTPYAPDVFTTPVDQAAGLNDGKVLSR